MQSFNMGRVPSVTFGAGRLTKVPDLVEGLGGGPVFIIADTALVEFGVVTRLTDALKGSSVAYEVAAEVAGEPKDTLINDLCARARDAGSACVVGLGGGAAMIRPNWLRPSPKAANPPRILP